jgi:hypothetical protein
MYGCRKCQAEAPDPSRESIIQTSANGVRESFSFPVEEFMSTQVAKQGK